MIAPMYRAALALLLTAGLTACDGGTGTSPTEATKKTEAASAPLIALGQIGGKDGVELTITEVTTPNQVGGGQSGVKASAGETFVVVNYTMKNVLPRPLPYLERPGLTLLDAQGNSYAIDDNASFQAVFMMADISGSTSDLNPNVSAKTRMAWKVDKAAFDKATWRIRLDTPSQPLFALQ